MTQQAPETFPAVIPDTLNATHGVRLSLVSTELNRQAGKLPSGTMADTQARSSEVDPCWLAHALKVMRGEIKL